MFTSIRTLVSDIRTAQLNKAAHQICQSELLQFQIEVATTFLWTPDPVLTALASRLVGRPHPVVVPQTGPSPATTAAAIFIPRKYMDMFTLREREAVVHHECYHVISGMFSGELAVEVAADSYAAEAGYAVDLRSALVKFKATKEFFPALKAELDTRIGLLA